MEPDLPGEPVVEREGEWAGDEVREVVGWVGRGLAQAQQGNACARNVEPRFLTKPVYPVIK